MTAELVGNLGRLRGQHPPDENGLTLVIRVIAGSPRRVNATQRCTACALTADALGLVTDSGAVYAVQLKQQRYKCLDVLNAAGTAAAFMTRLSRRLFVGCDDGEIYCYDYSSNSRLARLPGHRTQISSLSIKSDTEQLLSASTDAVLLWDMQTFRQRRMLSSAPYGSSQAVFSAAGNILAAAAGSAGYITIWHAKSLHELCRLAVPLDKQKQPFQASCISISPDELWLLVGCRSPALLLVYSLGQQQLSHALLLPEEMYGITQVHILPDSTSAAVLTSAGCISFLDFQSCSVSGHLHITSPGCRANSFSVEPRANSMAVVCNDGLVRLFDLATVRARQQSKQTALQQLQQLAKEQLQDLLGSVEPDASNNMLPAQNGAGGRQVLQVLSGVSNVPPKQQVASKAGKIKGSSIAAKAVKLQRLDMPAASLNRKKLQQLLAAYGEFPAKYRLMIWEHLLQLPRNSAAFTLVQDRGIHPAYKNLAQQMPGASRSAVAVRLQACLSQLAHWCPLFGEAGFLPGFAFPFVKLCGAKAESAFEMVATLLLNWCKGWFELFPHPPLPLLRRFLLAVSHHDLELGSHLQHLGVPLLQQLWHQLSGAMSDLLPSQSDWLVLWDHCLAAAAGPGFVYQLLCSYLITQRRLLLAVQDEQQLVRLFESRPAVDIQQIVKQAYKLQEATPDYALLGLTSLRPLPSAGAGGAGYPVFNEYPVGSVEQQALERRRIQEAEDALIRRRQVVAELEQRSKQVAFDSSALTTQRQQLAALDAQRRAAMRAIDDSLAAAGARLDDRSKEEKLKQIRLVEEAYQTSLSSLRAEWTSELATLKTDIDHKRRLAAAALKARQEEEDLKALEFQTRQRQWALQQEEMAAAGTSALQDAAAAQAAALTAERQCKAAEWQSEDEVRALRQQHETARQARLAAAAEQEAAKQAARGLLLTQELQAQEELLKVEHQRRLRKLAEDEAELTAKQLQLQVERQAVLAAAGQQAVQQQAQQQKERFTAGQQQRVAAVDQEAQALKQRQAELHAAAAEIGSTARMAAAEQQLTQLEQAIQQATEEEERQVQNILQELSKDKEQHQHIMHVLSAVTAEPEEQHRLSAAGPAAAPSRAPSEAPSSAAVDLEARLAALTAEMKMRSAAAAAQALAATTERPRSSAAESLERLGSEELRLSGESSLRDRLASLRAHAASRLAAAARADGSAVGDFGDKPGPIRRVRDSSESVESLVQKVESMNLGHALRAAQAAAASADATLGKLAMAASPAASSSAASSTTTSSSVSISQELEQLLAQTEAEVQRELAYNAATSANATAKQQPRQPGGPAARAANATAARLQPVPEEASHSSSTGSPAAAGVTARSAGRLSGNINHSPAASPVASAASSPARQTIPRSSLGPSAAASASVGERYGTSSGILIAGGSSSSSPAAVKLAMSGLEPITHQGRVVTRLADVLKHTTRPSSSRSTTSGTSSSGSSGHQRQQQQQDWSSSHLPAPAAQHTPETPSSTASMLTASSGSTLTGSSGSHKKRTAASGAAGGVQQYSTGARHEYDGGAADSTYSMYEPVLLRVQGQVAPVAEPGTGGLSSLTNSSSPDSTQASSSEPSSKSLSLGAAAAAADLAGHTEQETPMLGTRTRARTTSSGDRLSGFAAGGHGVALHQSSSSSTSSDDSSLSAPPAEVPSGHIGAARLGSRASSGGLQRGLDSSGRVSAELRQSSSATSQELEDLLQQLAQYEARLLQPGPSGGAPATQEPIAQEGGSEMGTSMSSVSWSQTLAGLANLLPRDQ